MHNSIKTLSVAAGLFLLTFSMDGLAASAAEIVEQARERARQIDEIKQVLNDPDQNVRLAAFEAMMTSGDALMRELALDTGMASTDQVLRGMALKHAILSRDQLTITLGTHPAAPDPVKARCTTYLEKNGASYVLNIDVDKADLNRGAFHLPGNSTRKGNVTGLVVTFDYGYHTGELHLQDDNTLAGIVHYNYGGDHQFTATAPLR